MTGPRRSTVFFSFMAACLLAFGAILAHAAATATAMRPAMKAKAAMVAKYGLADLCLFTEARYTRHPSMADRNTPFQDHPLSLEHFPSGSLMDPPPHLRGGSH